MKKKLEEFHIIKPIAKNTVKERDNYLYSRAFFHRYNSVWCSQVLGKNADSYEKQIECNKASGEHMRLFHEVADIGVAFNSGFYQNYENFEAQKIMELNKEGEVEIQFLIDYNTL